MKHIPLVLASASSARLKTLRSAGIAPVVCVSEVDEEAAVAQANSTLPEGEGPLPPHDVALLLARAKCEDVASRLSWGLGHQDVPEESLVLGCDSVLEIDGVAYGKPGTPEAARDRWELMRGRSGVLHTGHWLIDNRDLDRKGTGGSIGAVGSTVVHFADLSDREIRAYIKTGEPLNVAGAFTVDGFGGPFVTSIEGDYHNVVGVSLPLLRDLLGQLDIGWFSLQRLIS